MDTQLLITYFLIIVTAAYLIFTFKTYKQKGVLIGRRSRLFAAIIVFILCLFALIKGVTIFQIQTLIESSFR